MTWGCGLIGDRTYWVYLLTNGRYSTFCVGVTNSPIRRIAEHKADKIPGFSKVYGLDRSVFFRRFGDVRDAIHFEKQLERWPRPWKMRLIEEANPYWADLYLELTAVPELHPDLRQALAGAGATGSRSSPGGETGMTRGCG